MSALVGCGPNWVDLARVHNGGRSPSSECSAHVLRISGDAAPGIFSCGAEAASSDDLRISLSSGDTFVLWQVPSSTSLAGPVPANGVTLRIRGPVDERQTLGLRDGTDTLGLREGSSAGDLAQGSRSRTPAVGEHSDALTDGDRSRGLESGSRGVGLESAATAHELTTGSSERDLGAGTISEGLRTADRQSGGITLTKSVDRSSAGPGENAVFVIEARSRLAVPTSRIVLVDVIPSPLRVVAAGGATTTASEAGTVVIWDDRNPLDPGSTRDYRIVVQPR